LTVGKIRGNEMEQAASMSNNVTLNDFFFRGEDIIVSVDYENPRSRLKSSVQCKIKNSTKQPPFIYTVPIRNEKYQGEAGIAGLVRGNLFIDLRNFKMIFLVAFLGNKKYQTCS
jgi:hypothetical protein